jgi:hypothetical protein
LPRKFIMPEKYKVDLNSVLGCQMDDYDPVVVCEDFDKAKEYALDAFKTVIDRLTFLCEQIKAAESYEDLDLGWWEPLFVKIEGDAQSSEENRQAIESTQEHTESSTNPDKDNPPEQEQSCYLGGWGLSDLTEHYFCTEEEAREWFEKNEMALSEVCCAAGWEYIGDNIDFPNLEVDCEECPCCGNVFPWDEENPDENYWTEVECPCHDLVCNGCVHFDEGGDPVCPACGIKD